MKIISLLNFYFNLAILRLVKKGVNFKRAVFYSENKNV